MKRPALCFTLCVLPSVVWGQPVLQLSLARAIELATSANGNASIQAAAASVRVAESRVAIARALFLQTLESSVGEQNVTRNLAAEGFNFPTGVPNFTIPQGVGPFNNFDARVTMSQNVFDL